MSRFTRSISKLIVALLAPLMIIAPSGATAQSCSELFSHTSSVQLKIARSDELLAQVARVKGHRIVKSVSPLRTHETKITLKDPQTNSILASLDFEPSAGHVLDLGTLFVEKSHRRLGLSHILLTSALELFPQTEVIHSWHLSGTNQEVIKNGLARGLDLDQAVRETPAYKIRAQLGFTEIIPDSLDPVYFGFSVRRGAP